MDDRDVESKIEGCVHSIGMWFLFWKASFYNLDRQSEVNLLCSALGISEAD
jgi:hypothetical protein